VIDVSQLDLDERYYDDKTGALLPPSVTADALRVLENYPGNRLVIHYPRPPHQFVKSYGNRIFPKHIEFAPRGPPASGRNVAGEGS